jgi:hypothetical protein
MPSGIWYLRPREWDTNLRQVHSIVEGVEQKRPRSSGFHEILSRPNPGAITEYVAILISKVLSLLICRRTYSQTANNRMDCVLVDEYIAY